MNAGLTRARVCVASPPVRGRSGVAVSLGLHALAGCLVVLGVRSLVPAADTAPPGAIDMVFVPVAPAIPAPGPPALAAAVPAPPAASPDPAPPDAAVPSPPEAAVSSAASLPVAHAVAPPVTPARSPPKPSGLPAQAQAPIKPAPNQPAASGGAAAATTPAPSGQTMEAHPIAGLPTNTRPAYPKAAQRRGEQGTVVIRVIVGTDGRPRSASLEQSSGHALLDDAALAKIMEWRFVPAMQGGVTVAGAARVPFVFTLAE